LLRKKQTRFECLIFVSLVLELRNKSFFLFYEKQELVVDNSFFHALLLTLHTIAIRFHLITQYYPTYHGDRYSIRDAAKLLMRLGQGIDKPHCFPSNSASKWYLNQTAFDRSKHADVARYTQTLWEKVYPKGPFFFMEEEEEQQNSCTSNSEKSENQTMEKTIPHTLSRFDVLESCQCQATFLWQVSQIKFHDDNFLRQGVQNYYRFMSLTKMGDKKPRFLVPTYQIDLMWHTHILHSIRFYNEDCMNNIQS
jgi:hypothetical protein